MIDVAIGMVVLALILTPLIQVYNEYVRKQQNDYNAGTLSSVDQAVAQYFFDNEGRYPCPADPTLTDADPDYGIEIADCIANPLDGLAGTSSAGMVPFKTLNISEESAYDAWNRRFTYVVSVDRTTSPPTDSDQLDIETIDCVSGAASTETAAYVLITHGKRGIGAYSPSGTITTQCLSGVDATTESENCNHDQNILYTNHFCAVSDRQNDRYYDDLIRFRQGEPGGTWVFSSAPGAVNDVTSLGINLGINVNNPDDIDEDLVVAGTLYIQSDIPNDPQKEGSLIVDNLCVEADHDCIDPELIAGDVDAMDCASGIRNNLMGDGRSSAITGFSSRSVECSAYTDFTPLTCPSGQTATGIDPSTGDLICS